MELSRTGRIALARGDRGIREKGGCEGDGASADDGGGRSVAGPSDTATGTSGTRWRRSTTSRTPTSAALAGQKIAVLGFGSQGHAHAQNLQDSGHDVRRRPAPGSSSRAKAEEAGLRVLDTAEAVARGRRRRWCLLPDTSHGKVYAEDIAPNLNAGDMLMFAHGFTSTSARSRRRAGVDVTMIAPKGPGHLVRRTYEEGIGTPALVAVQQDATGKAKQRALAYGSGIGARPRRHHRDHVQGRDRDRPVRRADRAVRRASRELIRAGSRRWSRRATSRRSRTSSACTR